MLHKSARNSAYRGCKSEPLCPYTHVQRHRIPAFHDNEVCGSRFRNWCGLSEMGNWLVLLTTRVRRKDMTVAPRCVITVI